MGYQWKRVFLPDGTVLRTIFDGKKYHCIVNVDALGAASAYFSLTLRSGNCLMTRVATIGYRVRVRMASKAYLCEGRL